MRYFSIFVAALTFACGAADLAHAVPINPAVQYTTTDTLSDTRPFTLGYQFSLSGPVTIDALGYWANGTGTQQVGIWDSSNTLVASATVLGSDPLVANFLWATIPNQVLSAGTYTIGATLDAGGAIAAFPYNAQGITTIPEFTWITDEQTFGAGLNEPTFSAGGFYGTNGILYANFSVAVPEPATLALFGAGLLGLGAIRRRRKAKA